MRVVLHTVALAMACSSVRVHAANTSAERNHGRVLHASEMSRLRGRDDLSLARSLLEGQAAAARGEAAPPAPFASWAGDSAAVNDVDPLHQVSDFIARQDDERAAPREEQRCAHRLGHQRESRHRPKEASGDGECLGDDDGRFF